MNIVRGVAGLIRRSSSSHGGESSSGSPLEKFSPPTPLIHFSEVGDEAILNALWSRYENAPDKVEKRRLFYLFLKQFLVVYRDWNPINPLQSPEDHGFVQPVDSQHFGDVVVGCSFGHPSEIIAVLIEEVAIMIALVNEYLSRSSSTITSEGLPILDALAVITRSMHNCRVFGYYGGIQKLTALMKAAVVQLKAIASAHSADEASLNPVGEKTAILQNILLYVVSIIGSFINLHFSTPEKAWLDSGCMEIFGPRRVEIHDVVTGVDVSDSETMMRWRQKAIVSVMEAGGLNWLVELLRVMKRLNMKEQDTNISLHYLTLRALQLALVDNSRGQNHFRSIGGLEVLLDGLGVASNSALRLKNLSSSDTARNANVLTCMFQLHLLSLEVLRDAVFGNLNNLQFLSENGRVQKFANSFCSLAFMLQEFKEKSNNLFAQDDIEITVSSDRYTTGGEVLQKILSSKSSTPCLKNWQDYVSKLSAVLFTFLLSPEDAKVDKSQASTVKSSWPVSSAYGELSVKWIIRVLLTVFPCIKACSNQKELPGHLRTFMYTLQHHVLSAFKKILLLLPSLLHVFRAEGAWDFIFSENFFYFGLESLGSSDDSLSKKDSSDDCNEHCCDSDGRATSLNLHEIEALQTQVVSFMEFAATLSGSSHNLPECSILLEALEQSACNPGVANLLAKGLLQIMRSSSEKTLSSFKTLDAVPRVLKVACIQAQESKGHGIHTENDPEDVVNYFEMIHSWQNSMETFIELFTEFFSLTNDAKNSTLHSASCVDCLFDLFWEEKLRNRMLPLILDLMKIVPSSEEDQTAKLYLCSKYLETFTHVKDQENFVELSIDLLVGMIDLLLTDIEYYQALFRDGECFIHVVSLLNGNLDVPKGEELVLNVLQTLTCLLSGNEVSKAAFQALVGTGYQTLRSLLLDFCQWQPSEALLDALLDMLVDGKFDLKASPMIKNEDVILLYLSVLQKSSDSLRNQGLDVFLQLIRDSMSNQAACVKSGMLNFLLDWFPQEGKDTVVLKIAQLIQVIGGHSISGKDIRKIFALLRSEKVGSHQQYSSLLLTSMLSMLNEKGPTAFFDLNGVESGIYIKSPIQWPLNKGFSFTCWLRVESFPRGGGTMGLFSFLTESGRGCIGVLGKDKLIYESINQKRQSIVLQVNLARKKWHFLCLTHTIGRTFSGGSQLKCYLDGTLVSSEKCKYAKVNEPLTCCSIGTKISFPSFEEESPTLSSKDPSAFYGQIGPVYLFNDSIASEHVQGIYSLGPSYMYSFLDNETAVHLDSPLPSGVLDVKDGLASKIIFGLNSQARNGRHLFNVSPVVDPDKSSFEATVLVGTQLCSRRLLQQIIYCVGGVSVFFPLFTKTDLYEIEEAKQAGQALLTPITKERLTAEVIELISSVLDENLANQQQMLLLSGFPILGFLLQSVPPEQLNMDTLSALKHLFNVVANGGLSDMLVKDAISHIFLNPVIWVYSVYRVQRELFMFLIQQFDNDPRLLRSLCRLPRVLDIIRQFYWDDVKTRFAIGSKPLLHPVTKQVIGERPSKDEIHKVRLLLLSLGEMSLRQHISASDIISLIAFFDRSQDMACIEDVLHMVIRAVSQKQLLASFLEQINLIGGCHIFVNLLERDFEPIRLLGLQFLGRLLVGLPLEKKGSKFFSIAVGRSKSLPEGLRKVSSRTQPIFSVISDRLFKFPQTDLLCATLFDVLLGGASPKQVLQKHNQLDRQKSSRSSSQFFLPQILAIIFRFLSGCEDASTRIKIISDLLYLLESNSTNIEALMEHGWNAWLDASVKLNALKNYKLESKINDDTKTSEQNLLKSFYCVVLCHYMYSIKGGWQHLEETVNFLLVQCEQGGIAYRHFLRDMYEDLVRKLLDLSAVENVLVTQPCRDNMLYLLKLVDEMLLSEMKFNLPYPSSNTEFSSEFLELEQLKDLGSALLDALQGEPDEKLSRNHVFKLPDSNEVEKIDDGWWNLCDNIWNAISEMNGKGPSKMLPRFSQSIAPSLSQRARGLVESLNIPAAEMAAVVVSGGISNALAGKTNKPVDKAMLLRGEKCPRIVFRLIILYLCKSSLERASRCVQQIIPLLPCLLTADDEQSKSRLQLFIWALLAVRSHYGALDDGARFHVIAHIIRETVNCGKLILATSIVSRDDSLESGSSTKEGSTIHNLIQKDRVLSAFADEVKYIKNSTTDRTAQLHELRARLDEMTITDSNQKKAFEEEIQSSLNAILASDDNRRSSFQLAYDEQQQIVAGKWIHTFRSLIDERGPWSADPFPNSTLTHWKLDKTEDAWRRRQKLRRNYHFDEKLCRPTSTTPNVEVFNPSNDAKSDFAAHIPEQMKRFLLKGIRRITEEASSELNESESELSGQKPGSEDLSDRQYLEVVKESSDLKDIAKEDLDCSTQMESEDSEVLMSVPCVLVTPKRKLAGHLAVKKKFLHFFGECLVEGTGGSSVFRNFDSSGKFDINKLEQLGGLQNHKFPKWPVSYDLDCERGRGINSIGAVNNDEQQKHPKNINRHRRWTIFKVKAVHWTRYLLSYTAIEIFFSDSTAPVFFNFASQKVAKDVGSLIVLNRNESMFPKGYRDKAGVISFVDRRVALEMAENARERWKRREITNFEYLMVLNTLAGRSYNDLTQYPVFPWVLADYSSETLDFNKSSTFRDLSKPVGALDAKRFEVFEDRYRNFCDPDIPSFYYGSHYSSMGIVLFYLLRLEPFTSLHRNLQGGKFDHADRLFHSIGGTYRNCLSNTSDVKELIPEFFYMPEFLINSNSYHFGVKQDGEPIGDVCLPPWAKGCPEEFISKNREALESEYVSSNLHQWIDLVFGYKQRGKPAVEVANIFYYLTYEGAVDLDTMDDELQRSAIEDQIANFGQTPIQLFRKKHPRRGPPIPIAHPLRFAPGSINLTSMASCASSYPSATLYVSVLDSNIVLVNQGPSMSVKTWVTTQLQSGGNFTFSSSQDPFFGIGSDILPPRKIGSPLAENIELGAQCFGTLSTPSENFLITCGTCENSFQVISLTDGRMVQSIRQHKDVVSCISVTSDGSTLATGSYDTTVMIWEIVRMRNPEKRVKHTQAEVPRKDCIIAEAPFHILCGHDDVITCLYASIELDIVISGSKDGTCVFHTLRDGRYVRSLRHPSGSPLSKLVASRHGRIVLYSDDDLSLHLYSINGKHISSSESNGRLNCLELSSCGEFLVCAGDQGSIIVRSMNSLEIVGKYNGIGKIVTSLTVTPEECFIAGTKDGSLLVYSIENPQIRKTSVPKNSKSKASMT